MAGSAFTRNGASGSLDSDAALEMAAGADAVFQRANAAAEELAAASLQDEEQPREDSANEAAGWEIVHQHNSEYACWIVIAGRVLDATAYLGHHPGGATVIRRLAGKDATKAYEKAHHSRAADLKLYDFDIGALTDLKRLSRSARAAREYQKRLEAAATFLE